MKILATCCFLLGTVMSFSQTPSGTPRLMSNLAGQDFHKRLYQKVQSFSSSSNRSTIIVPVVFHIVYANATENINDSLISQQLQRLNLDFRRENADTSNTPVPFDALAGSMDIEFCLAQQTPNGLSTNGIIRKSTTEIQFNSPNSYTVPDPIKHDSLGGSNAWDTQNYLNIWICNLSGSTAYTAPPGNFAPEDDGIVCHYNHVGNSGVLPYGKGRTIVHEMGHYFCLKHIWGDDGNACSGTDYMPDTPNQAGFNTNCPTFPVTDICSPQSPGVMFMNYMDYTSDECRNMFTIDQTNYMTQCLDVIFSNFENSTGCMPPTLGISYGAYNKLDLRYSGKEVLLELPIKANLVRLIGINGQTIKTWLVSAKEQLRIDSENYSSGIYMLHVYGSKGYAIGVAKIKL